MPAVRLFVERVRDVQPAFRLTAENAQAVIGICRRLDALPLALELAAPWMKALTADDLLTRLEHDVLRSTAGARDLPERQRTMNATVAWSYQLLDEHERHAFRRFGALPCRFSIEAAAAVLGGRGHDPLRSENALTATAGLIDKSLLHRADTSLASRPLYQMLETVQAYAASELAASGERDEALDGLAGYCVHQAAEAGQRLVEPSQIEWLDRVRDDLDNYRSAMTWLIERGRSAEASDIAWRLLFFWVIRGRAGEGLRWYEQALSVPGLPLAAESRALVGAAIMTYTQGISRTLAPAPFGLWNWRGAPTTGLSWCRPRTCSGTSNTRRAMRPALASCSPAAWKDSRRSVSRGARGTRSLARPASPLRSATPHRPNDCSMRPPRCFVRPGRGS